MRALRTLAQLTRSRRALWLVALVALLVVASTWGWRSYRAAQAAAAVEDEYCVVAPPTAFDPTWGVGLLEARPIPPDARCPVCGMFPARNREWAAQLVFHNGDTQFFDSPLTLWAYVQDVGRYAPGRQASEIAALWVSDAATGRWTDARRAHYVHGSNALGPMRAGNLPAFAALADAQAFAKARGGAVLAAERIDQALVGRLLRPHRHAQMAAPGTL
ncbi:MAG: hypothetical protein E6Q78_00540 [Rhodoferax sp.]|nr:MAG: hypothetical protein E6Q78_00540 [Rhodoferax sp.]